MNYNQNFIKILNQSNESDIDAGKRWYRDARLFAYHLSKKYNVPFKNTCAVIASLSPRNRWERNKIDAENLILWSKGLSSRPKFATYNAMVSKALDCMGYESKYLEKILQGPKILNFYKNILDDSIPVVTVDSWIHQAACGKYQATKDRESLNITEYRDIESSLKSLAIDLNIPAPQLQAIIWITFKRIVEKK